MPFTTANNYNWLFDVGGQQNFSMPPEQQTSVQDSHVSMMQFQSPDQNTSGVFKLNDSVSGNTSTSTDALFKQPALPQQQPVMEAFQMSEIFQFNAMTPHNTGMVNTISHSPMGSDSTANHATEVDFSPATTTSPDSMHTQAANQPNRMLNNAFNMQTLPPSQPRRSMPTMDEVSRRQILDLLVSARPKTPEGSEISRDHHLLSLSSMQNYLDLFFSRFNVAYPLLHQATFDPSQTEPLLLLAVLLLGATYSEKAIHRLAVCIHDVLRAQIFQHSAFSATPELWMLQTILLVECFGKSRAGQKQHDMAHLFHGLLIKYITPMPTECLNLLTRHSLIRRSDCQTVRQPNFGDGSGDLEADWRKAIDVELRKRSAALFLYCRAH